jgi:2-polyprenyl-6-hydroxyphenyl methylase/3-demethylubiquinone-9 3-methyltransferase
MAQIRRNDLGIYDRAAARWWSDEVRWVRALKNLVPARLRHFDRFIDWHGKAVLDLGCAGGFMAEALDDRGARVSGLDPAERAIAAAGTHAAQTGRVIDYRTGVGEALPYPGAAFDAVVCVDVLEHVANLRQVMQEAARVLRPGGLFFFDTINRTAIARLFTITLAEDVLRVLPKGTHDPALFIRPDELRTRMHEARLAPQPFTGLGPRFIDRRGDPTFGRIPLTSVLYMGHAIREGKAE